MVVCNHCLELTILYLDVIFFVTFLDLVACQLRVQHLCSLPLVIKLRLQWVGLALHQLDLLVELLLELLVLLNLISFGEVLRLIPAALWLPSIYHLAVVLVLLLQLFMFIYQLHVYISLDVTSLVWPKRLNFMLQLIILATHLLWSWSVEAKVTLALSLCLPLYLVVLLALLKLPIFICQLLFCFSQLLLETICSLPLQLLGPLHCFFFSINTSWHQVMLLCLGPATFTQQLHGSSFDDVLANCDVRLATNFLLVHMRMYFVKLWDANLDSFILGFEERLECFAFSSVPLVW